MIIAIFGWIGSFGGFVVIAGSIFVVAHHEFTGKWIARFGIGISIFGILVLLITTLWSGTTQFLVLIVTMAQSFGWIGIFVSMWGTFTVKKTDVNKLNS